MITRPVLILFLILFIPTMSMAQDVKVSPLSELRKTLYFHGYYHPVMVMVGDKESPHTSVYLYDEENDLSDWDEGEEVDFVIKDKEGAGLVRKNTGKFYKIMVDPTLISDWGIDCVAKSGEQVHLCDRQVAAFWQKEQKLLFNHLHAMGDAAFQKALDETEKDWVAYRDALYKSRGTDIDWEMAVALENDRYDHLVLMANVY